WPIENLSEFGKQLKDFLKGGPFGVAIGGLGARPKTQLEIFPNGQMRNDFPSLRDVYKPSLDSPIRGFLGDVCPAKFDLPSPCRKQTHDRLQRRCLPHTVPSHQTGDLARFDGKQHVTEDVTLAIVDVELFNLQHHVSSLVVRISSLEFRRSRNTIPYASCITFHII